MDGDPRRRAGGPRRLHRALPVVGTAGRRMTGEDRVLQRIERRAIIFTTLSAVVASAFNWRAALSLTISAGVVISSLLVLEKLTVRLVPPQEKHGIRALVPFLLVTVVSVLLLGVAAFRWKGFSMAAGAAGISAAVAAVVLEGFESRR